MRRTGTAWITAEAPVGNRETREAGDTKAKNSATGEAVVSEMKNPAAQEAEAPTQETVIPKEKI